MTPDERELRRALDARSGNPSPAFRARLSAALADAGPARDLRPPLAIAASVILVVGTIAILLLSRHGAAPAPSRSLATPPAVSKPAPTPVPTPVVSPSLIALPTTVQLSAPSSNVLWALVDDRVLFRSTDRGSTWQRRPQPFSPDQLGPVAYIAFLDDRHGWITGSGQPMSQCQEQTTTIWHTNDAGDTWERLGDTGWTPGCKGALTFIDSAHGFISSSSSMFAPVIYRTADGGRTWTASRPLPDPPGFTTQPGGVTLQPDRVQAFGSTLLVAADGYVFRSTDGGVTWSYVAGTPDHPSSIAFVTARRWLELSTPTQSGETLDAGRTWHAYPSDYSQAAPVAPEVVFGDPQVGYATVRGTIQRTLDGGLHWSVLGTPGTG